MEARLASSVHVSALIRRAEGEGGFAAVLAKGDPTSGAISVILIERGRKVAFLERLLQPDGAYRWQNSGQSLENDDELKKLLEQRRRFDRDMWILELDIPSAERFAAEMNAIG